MTERPFWEKKRLSELTRDEWESLCDRCGRCCLHKLEDEDSGDIVYTNVACKLLDAASCRCTDYAKRSIRVPDCLDLKSVQFTQYHWLPSTCAYRRLAEGNSLPSWHPLITGDEQSVHTAGISVRDYAVAESHVNELARHVIEWLT